MNCVDLEEQFGSVYQVEYEDGVFHRARDAWRLILTCRHGHFYPHGGEILGASTNTRGAIANQLAALPCVRVVQDGSDGINAIFHVDDFESVAALLKPRRRRRLTPDQKAERTERLRKHRFRKGSAASQSVFGAHRRDPMGWPTKSTAPGSCRRSKAEKTAGN